MLNGFIHDNLLNRTRKIILLLCLASVAYLCMSRTWISFELCSSKANSTSRVYAYAPRKVKNDTGYLTYIISAVPQRLNFTSTVLNTRLPGFFNTHYKLSVPHNDSRIFYKAGIHAASLMLTYIDLWREIGSKPDTELSQNDWVFVFEDDVDIVPIGILKAFYSKVYLHLNGSATSTVLAGMSFFFIGRTCVGTTFCHQFLF